MGKVGLDKTMSLDGFIAGPNDDVTRLFEWYGGKPTEVLEALGDPLKTIGTVVIESPGVTHLSFRVVKGGGNRP